MKRAALIGALIVSLAAGSAAMASPGGHGNGHGHGRDDYREHRSSHRYDYRPGPPVRAHRAPVRYYGAYQRPYGYYSHRWVRGDRLPAPYYARPYWVADYGVWGLYPPPRGYHWVRVDGDAVLAAIATGIVLETVFHAFN